jgi:hypothetical protein
LGAQYRQLLNDNTSYRQAAFISQKGAPSSQELVTETEVRVFKELIKKSVLVVSGYCLLEQFFNQIDLLRSKMILSRI